MMIRKICIVILLLAASTLSPAADLFTDFSYQGYLLFNEIPANGTFDFQVELFDDPSGGAQIGDFVSIEDVNAVDGVFALELDFGALPFAGDQLWLNIGVREGASSGGYTGLLPRQKITATPFALYSETVAAGAVGSNEIDATQVQRRVTSNCGVGSFITAINQDGSVTCATDMVGLSSVTGAEIVDGSVGAIDINPNQVYTLGGAIINGATNINGPFTVDSGADVKILDDFNGFRWYSSDGLTQFGAILMRSTEATLRDFNQSRYVITSRPNGIGVGTSAPVAGYAVTMPSLTVSGQTDVGLVRVSASYELSSTGSCHSHGNLTCYYGTGSVQCPVGTRVLGGGTSGSSARFGSIGQSFAASSTSWVCSASYDLVNNSRTCYAICARLE